jgi:hypothetical protein
MQVAKEGIYQQQELLGHIHHGSALPALVCQTTLVLQGLEQRMCASTTPPAVSFWNR